MPTPDMTGDMAPWGMPMLPCPMPMCGRGCPGMAPEYAYPWLAAVHKSASCGLVWTTQLVCLQTYCDDCKGYCVAQAKV